MKYLNLSILEKTSLITVALFEVRLCCSTVVLVVETYLPGNFSQFDDAQLGAGARLLLLLQALLPLTDFELHHLDCYAGLLGLD